ncbi:hypothetical protein KQX54_019611 [Cotesia glomerata]|uniref:Uncharacterized protein n=1 Tax=Cotesia glomerata TaxID=32391 RepID=A0AAV7IGI7_COTGL|nr:hypothetical protein KQX54_019611 [Cotesia glomerata]
MRDIVDIVASDQGTMASDQPISSTGLRQASKQADEALTTETSCKVQQQQQALLVIRGWERVKKGVRESSGGVIHPTWVHTPIHRRAAIATPPTAADMMLILFKLIFTFHRKKK